MHQSQRSAKKPASSPFDVDRQLLVNMISRVNDPVVARIFLNTLDMYPDLKLQFLGAYLMAEETVKRSQIRYAKAHDLGQATARIKRKCLELLGALWSLSVCCAHWARDALHEHKRHKFQQSAKPQTPSTNVIMLPLSRKATGTDH
ncbi:hypothetical protein CTR2_R26490 [Comamonas thiooxydans]|uniref:hypothetical protein n=1 Tax=Comamonas thiooxydans TaxID=363952 RepID=UPI000B360461|nr:hypothetical protein [Comamonas thiooxydans]BDR09311.1 hypothetical protein CTR2_R26490 [Comamonas thiooxydans]